MLSFSVWAKAGLRNDCYYSHAADFDVFRLLSLVASRDIRTRRPGCPQECSPGLSRHSRETEVEALYLEVL